MDPRRENNETPIRLGWDQAAPLYRDGLGIHLGEIAGRLADLLTPLPRLPVLDLACGPGTVLSALLAKNGIPDAVGCDFSIRMVEFARKTAAGSCGVVADQDSLPFVPESFGTVVSSMGTIFSRDPASQIQQISRILKPGGKYGFSAWGKPEETALGAVSRKVIDNWPYAYKGQIPPLESPYSAGRSPWLEHQSMKAGLTVDRVLSDRIVFRFPDTVSAAKAIIGTGRFALLMAGEGREKELLEQAMEAFLPHRNPDTGKVELENRYHLFVLVRQS